MVVFSLPVPNNIELVQTFSRAKDSSRSCSDDALQTGEQNVNLSKKTLEIVASNKMFHLDKRAPSNVFKVITTGVEIENIACSKQMGIVNSGNLGIQNYRLSYQIPVPYNPLHCVDSSSH